METSQKSWGTNMTMEFQQEDKAAQIILEHIYTWSLEFTPYGLARHESSLM